MSAPDAVRAVWSALGVEAPRALSYGGAPPHLGAYSVFLYGLVRMRTESRAPVHVCEIGTYHGFGSVALRRAQLDGDQPTSRLWLIEKQPDHARATRTSMQQACVWDEQYVTQWVGSAETATAHIPDDLDVIVEDNGHGLDETMAHFERYSVKLLPGGIMLFHDQSFRRYDDSAHSPPVNLFEQRLAAVLTAHNSRLPDDDRWVLFRPGGSYLAVQRGAGALRPQEPEQCRTHVLAPAPAPVSTLASAPASSPPTPTTSGLEPIAGVAPESYAALVATKTSTYQTVTLSRSPRVVVPGTFDTEQLWRGFGLPEHLWGRSVLDVGCCMGGYVIEALHRSARLGVGIDLDAAALAWAARATAYAAARTRWAGTAKYLRGDAFTFRPKFEFDIVLCLSLLHHIADPMLALSGLRRWIAEGGYAIVEMETWTDSLPRRGGVQARTIEDWCGAPPTPGAVFGRGVYPTAACVVAALTAAGFHNVESLGCVRQSENMHRDAFRCG